MNDEIAEDERRVLTLMIDTARAFRANVLRGQIESGKVTLHCEHTDADQLLEDLTDSLPAGYRLVLHVKDPSHRDYAERMKKRRAR